MIGKLSALRTQLQAMFLANPKVVRCAPSIDVVLYYKGSTQSSGLGSTDFPEHICSLNRGDSIPAPFPAKRMLFLAEDGTTERKKSCDELSELMQ